VPPGVAVAGIPARPVSDRGSDGLLFDTVLR
jgi:acetyltransferase-like isoleucine patch superfamily enzyme